MLNCTPWLFVMGMTPF